MSEKNPTNSKTDSIAHGDCRPVPCSLFVGGPQDGKRMAVPMFMQTVAVRNTRHSEDIYRVEILGAPGRTWRVCVWENLTLEDAMEMLIQNYSANID